MFRWALLVILHFYDGTSAELPAPTRYDTHDECHAIGLLVEEILTQDGVRVEWKCVEVYNG